MSKSDENNESVKPLDMTTDEAINFLFPKEVVDELKNVACPERKDAKANENGDSECDDESYA